MFNRKSGCATNVYRNRTIFCSGTFPGNGAEPRRRCQTFLTFHHKSFLKLIVFPSNFSFHVGVRRRDPAKHRILNQVKIRISRGHTSVRRVYLTSAKSPRVLNLQTVVDLCKFELFSKLCAGPRRQCKSFAAVTFHHKLFLKLIVFPSNFTFFVSGFGAGTRQNIEH